MNNQKLNLNEVNNKNCIKNCNKDDRRIFTDNGLCAITNSVIDTLPVRCVGSWAEEKIYFLAQYFEIFSIGMKNKWKCNINYIEICCGPGRCIIRESGNEIDGTSLAIINSDAITNIKRAVFIDKDKDIIKILNKRIEKYKRKNNVTAFVGDYNNKNEIKKILSTLDENCLNLVFIDPTDCSVPFETIRLIKNTLKKCDLIINIAFGTDLKRNMQKAVVNKDKNYKNVINKYSDFLGDQSFFKLGEVIKYSKEKNHSRLINLFIDTYERNLKNLGFNFFGKQQIKHYYFLLFASNHKTGFDFWNKANKILPNGQYTLKFLK